MSRLVARTRATVTARDRVPPWAVITVGAVCALLGAAVVLRPFASLALLVVAVVAGALVLGVAELVGGGADERTTALSGGALARPRRLRLVRGGLFLALAVAVALWPAPSIVVVALLVGAGLVVAGLLDALEGVRSAGVDRWTRVGLGAASVVLGLVALSWPDVTVLVVAVVLGVRLVVLGVRLVVAGVRRTRTPGPSADLDTGLVEAPGTATTRPHGRAALVGAVLAVVAAGGLAVVSVGLHRAAPRSTRSTTRRRPSRTSPVGSCAPNPSPARSPTGRRPGASSTRRRATRTSPRWRAGSSWCRTPRRARRR
ncbi:DUF308 domain-containing protein [Cellulosimicrobium cellulans]|uniref:HdeD family acid-resistance protein n=1 Tax=Cellulosimicrobium cellulans TaxID=1710 RepID=UPI00214A5888|nr:DUF308 domain-containing protein [Cellulosimicrobium cellulans]